MTPLLKFYFRFCFYINICLKTLSSAIFKINLEGVEMIFIHVTIVKSDSVTIVLLITKLKYKKSK